MIPPEATRKEETTDMSTGGPQPGQAQPQPGQAQPQPGQAQPQPGQAHAAADAHKPTTKPATGHGIEVRDLNAYYGDQHSIKNFTIDFPANQVTALIGPSGSGKSTVVRCINRLHEEIPGARAEGTVALDGLNVYDDSVDVTAVRRLIGMVFQKPNPFPTMSVFENVAAGLKLTGTRGVNLRERVHWALRSVGLWDEVETRLNQPGTALSGGQQQRLCIARTVAVEPEVILMDEPASALDPISTLKIEELIDELKERYTIVIVTHNMQQAGRVADTTAFMLDGELVEHGPTTRIFTHPTDERTERYVTGKFG
jgi:phosphate transport system ATP-binding protein